MREMGLQPHAQGMMAPPSENAEIAHRTVNRRRFLLLAGCVGASTLLAACGGRSAPNITKPASPATSAVPTTSSTNMPPPVGHLVEVTLTDFRITASQTDFIVGVPFRFVITNTSQTPHEFAITPMMHAGHVMSDAEMHATSLVHIDAGRLPIGIPLIVMYTFSAQSAAGQSEFACHISGHYEAGMHTPIVINQA